MYRSLRCGMRRAPPQQELIGHQTHQIFVAVASLSVLLVGGLAGVVHLSECRKLQGNEHCFHFGGQWNGMQACKTIARHI